MAALLMQVEDEAMPVFSCKNFNKFPLDISLK
jgi:hypothetical protein